jgi:hypothetical protein
MARNNRIFYACQAVIIVQTGTAPVAGGLCKGLQSVGMSSTFTLDQVFEMGQIEIYENIEDVADIEVTLEKVLDGEKMLFALCSNDLCKTDLVAASKNRVDAYLGIFDDGLSHATGIPRNICWNSGMFTSSVSYSYSTDGSATESVTLVGNDRFWNDIANYTGTTADTQWATELTALFDGTDVPKSGVARRVNVDLDNSTLPGITKSQGDPDTAAGIGGGFHMQSISVSTDMAQENIMELGRFGPYTRYATFPIEVTCEIEVMSTSGDLQSVSGNGTNLGNEQIIIKDTVGTVLDLGTSNKLTGVSYSGGDTGGGNSTVSYSYSNYNVLLVGGGS